ncbi:MAG: undecaprenyldiphospho-muramoylpentapeptide beta-N-acetylglucosaminyltransferase [Acidobacteria bacterium]|nr:undecaprenyldiphospho-muramoylpentapeptide beta-N-acetylglucosaminyltransferase [Acidobacteriota bacterium]
MRILFAGGGTGGHLYPGIAVADELRRRDPATVVSFVGTARGLESRVVPALGLPLDLIRSAGLKGKSVAALLRGLALLPLSALDAWRVLSARRPDVVVGVGGYSSGPVLLLAALRGLPTLLMEQNTAPGFTNRRLAPWVRAAALSYEETLQYFPGKGVVTGNPVRHEFLQALEAGDDAARNDGEVRVLIVGGSQGARAINDAMIAAAPLLAGTRLVVTHQTGERDLTRVRDGYAAAGVAATVEPFFHDMNARMRAADVLVARAGASTLAELTVLGRASVLVPLPTAADDHQRKNARVLAEAGAAEVIEEKDLSGAALAQILISLAGDPLRRRAMADHARSLGRPDAAARVADRISALAGGH